MGFVAALLLAFLLVAVAAVFAFIFLKTQP
jgi:hypothetical protein